MQVVARGFKQETQQVDIQPNQMARADSILSIGSVSESISVTAETAQVQLSSGSAKDQAIGCSAAACDQDGDSGNNPRA